MYKFYFSSLRFIPVLLIGFLLVTPVHAQIEDEKAYEKAQEKNEKKIRQQEEYENLLELANSQRFVLEANLLYDRYNNSYPVSPATNFLAIDSNQVTLQIAFPARVGDNGLGGITIDGTVTGYRVNTRKKNITVYANVSSYTTGQATLIINFGPGDRARARVNGTFGREITFNGYIMPVKESSVYKGISRF